VECDPPQKVVLDGELLGETPVHARVKPASLRVVVPRPPAAAAAGAGSEAAAVNGNSAAPQGAPGAGAAPAAADDPAAQLVQESARVESLPVVAPEPKQA
jgi:hypothetical protein